MVTMTRIMLPGTYHGALRRLRGTIANVRGRDHQILIEVSGWVERL